jgi:rubredoxin
VDKPTICPVCGSDEVRETTRVIGLYDEITAFVCPVCDWASDPRIGRPPADRSKNFTLRRLINDRKDDAEEDS